jgi:hypothetical protein
MPAAQIIFIARIAAWIALVPYATAVLMYGLFRGSGYGAEVGLGRNLGPYLPFYFAYVASYVALAATLGGRASLLTRLLSGFSGAVFVGLALGLALTVGVFLGMLLILPGTLVGLGPMASMLAIPIVGLAVGEAVSLVLAQTAGWPVNGPAVSHIKFAHRVAGAIAACLAFYFDVEQANGVAPAYGFEFIGKVMLAGLAGPLVLVAALSIPLPASQAGTAAIPLDTTARRGLAVLMAFACVVLAAEALALSVKSEHKLWTAKGLSSGLATAQMIADRRKPPADQPVRMKGYVVDVRPANLEESYYDWRTGQFINATFKLGTTGSADGPVEVRAMLLASQERGLGYVCDPPVEGTLLPCTVAGREAQQSDSTLIRVGLYQGQSQIGRLGRTFMISCRYSAGFCKVEFTEPWFDGIRVAVLYKPQDMERWRDVVPFAIRRFEALIRPAS